MATPTLAFVAVCGNAEAPPLDTSTPRHLLPSSPTMKANELIRKLCDVRGVGMLVAPLACVARAVQLCFWGEERRELVRCARAGVIAAALAASSSGPLMAAFGGWLGLERTSNTDKILAVSVAPRVSFLTVAGSATGPWFSPICVRIDWDNTTLVGRRDQAYIEWRARVDGGEPTIRISAIDPIDGTVKDLYRDRHTALCNILPREAGTWTIEGRVFDGGTGLNSGYSLAISAERTEDDPAKYGYCNLAAGSSGDGSSWAQAVNTNALAVTLANTIGAGATIFFRSGTFSSDGGRPTVANVRFTADPDAVGAVTMTSGGNFSFIEGGGSTDGVLIDGMTFTGTQGRIFNSEVDGSKNICIWNCTYGGIKDVFVAQGDARVLGLSLINLTESAGLSDGQVVFANDLEGCSVFGLDAPVGSLEVSTDGEHTFRFQNVSGVVLCGFHSFEYCTVGNSVGGGGSAKGALRWLAGQDLGCHGCVFKGWVLIGFVSPGGTSPGGNTFTFERCRFERASDELANRVDVYSSWTDGSFRNCYFNQMRFTAIPRDGEDGADYIEDLDFLQCTFNPSSSAGIRIGGTSVSALTNNPRRIRVRGCLFSLPEGMTASETYIQIQGLATLGSDSDINNNLFERANSTDKIYHDNSSANITYTLAEGDALDSISGDVRVASMTYDADTLEADEGLTAVTPGAPFPHISYHGGFRYNYAAENWPAGACLSEGAAGSYDDVGGSGWPFSTILL